MEAFTTMSLCLNVALLMLLVSADKLKHSKDCKNKKGLINTCSPDKEETQTSAQALMSESLVKCQTIATTGDCLTKLQMKAALGRNMRDGLRRERKNGKEQKRKRKYKNKIKTDQNMGMNTDNKTSSDLPEHPSPPSELSVEPHMMSAIISWQPPHPDATGDPVHVDSYKIGYGQGFPDLRMVQVGGQEVTYLLQNLEPGREYIVSLRAKTSLGVSQPLYETIRTHTAEDSEEGILPPVGVRTTVLSSEAINVTWVDLSKTRETAARQTDYYVKYRQLTQVSSSATGENDFKMHVTSDTYIVVRGLQPFSRYEFAIMASDGQWNSSWSVMARNVTKSAAPSSPPRDLTIIADTSSPRQVILSWQPPTQANGVLTGYVVSYNTISKEAKAVGETKDVLGNKLSLTLHNLIPGQTYNFSVRARNSRGLGPRLTVRNYLIPEDYPSHVLPGDTGTTPGVVSRDNEDETVKPVRQLRMEVLSATSAVVTWQDPGLLETLEDEMSPQVTTYTVRYRSLEPHLSNYTMLPSPFTTLYVADLLPATRYEFRVKVHRGHRSSEWSVAVRNKTFPADSKSAVVSLPRPDNLQVTVMSPNSALISWHEPVLGIKENMEKSLTYMLRYRDLTSKSSGYKFAAPTLTSIFMVDLDPATAYEFSVRTDYGDHHSAWSSPVVNTTFDSAPSTGPSHVTITLDDGDPTTAFLTWQPPEVPNGNITGYIVFYETATERKSATVPAGELSYRITFLKPHTKYFFRIGAWNSQGFSPLSNRVVYRTPRVVGLPPADVTVSPASDDLYNAIVSWQPPSSNKRKIKFYTVTCYTEDGKHRTVLKVPAYTLTTIARKLLPSVVYHFTVQAHYQRDSGPHSTAVQYSIPKELL